MLLARYAARAKAEPAPAPQAAPEAPAAAAPAPVKPVSYTHLLQTNKSIHDDDVLEFGTNEFYVNSTDAL